MENNDDLPGRPSGAHEFRCQRITQATPPILPSCRGERLDLRRRKHAIGEAVEETTTKRRFGHGAAPKFTDWPAERRHQAGTTVELASRAATPTELQGRVAGATVELASRAATPTELQGATVELASRAATPTGAATRSSLIHKCGARSSNACGLWRAHALWLRNGLHALARAHTLRAMLRPCARSEQRDPSLYPGRGAPSNETQAIRREPAGQPNGDTRARRARGARVDRPVRCPCVNTRQI